MEQVLAFISENIRFIYLLIITIFFDFSSNFLL